MSQRSLTNAFPFNILNGEQGRNEVESSFSSLENRRIARQGGVEARIARQGGGVEARVDFDAVASSRPGNDGKRCIDKVATTIIHLTLSNQSHWHRD